MLKYVLIVVVVLMLMLVYVVQKDIIVIVNVDMMFEMLLVDGLVLLMIMQM